MLVEWICDQDWDSMQTYNLRGILLMILSMLGFAIEDVFLKLLSDTIPASQLLVLTGFGAAAVLAAIAKLQGAPIYSNQLWERPIIIRTLADLVGAIFFIWSIVLLPLTILSSIIQAIPLAVTAGAALILGERVGVKRWTAIAIGFIGVLIIIRPTTQGVNIGALLALIFVAALAVRDLVTRQIRTKLPSVTISIYGFVAMGTAGLVIASFSTPYVWPTTIETLWLALAILFAVIGYYMIVISTRIGDASVVAPFRYSRLVFAVMLSFVFLGETIDPITGLGIFIVITSGLYTFWREARLRKSQSK